MHRVSRLSVPGLVALGALAVPVALSPGQQGVVVEPPRVRVRLFYAGTTVHVRAPVPEATDVAVAVVGAVRPLVLERKGKVLRLVWMNVGEVTFEAVPDLLLVRATCPLEELAAPGVLRRLGLAPEALGAPSESGTPDDDLFAELVKLKRRDGVWDVAEGGVDLRAGGGGSIIAATDFFLPPGTPPGDYQVLVYAFADGDGERVGEGRLQVVQTGVAAFISSLAKGHGLLYGILAVVVAAAAGLLTGVVFDLGSGKGHRRC